jgi:hypothetical protein
MSADIDATGTTPSDAAGDVLETIYAQITSSAGDFFAWTEQTPILGGGWLEGPRSSKAEAADDPAYEADGAVVESLPFYVVLHRQVDSRRWLFQAPAFFRGQG